MSLKNMTSIRKVIEIMNRYGQSCSYNILEEIETQAAFSIVNDSPICPPEIIRQSDRIICLAWDNFDLFVNSKITGGKDTIHDTVGIISQIILPGDHDEHDDTILNVSDVLEADKILLENDSSIDHNGSSERTVIQTNNIYSPDSPSNNETTSTFETQSLQSEGQVSDNEYSIDNHISFPDHKNSKRKFVYIPNGLEPINKKLCIKELLLPLNSPLRDCEEYDVTEYIFLDRAWMISFF